MKIKYDPEVDALSIVFRDATVTIQEWAEGIAGEYDSQGLLSGIEILDVKQRLGTGDSLQEIILEGIDRVHA